MAAAAASSSAIVAEKAKALADLNTAFAACAEGSAVVAVDVDTSHLLDFLDCSSWYRRT